VFRVCQRFQGSGFGANLHPRGYNLRNPETPETDTPNPKPWEANNLTPWRLKPLTLDPGGLKPELPEA
jgi:hypothetical protein